MGAFSSRSFWLPVLTTTLVAALLGAILARRGRQLERMQVELARLEARLARLKAQNERLKAERDALLSSPEAIERVAREQYGFAAPGEEVTEFAEPPLPARRGPAARVDPSPWERALTWRHLSVAVPAGVFVATAVAFAALNVLAGRRSRRPQRRA
jgi:cell division protein FtsB